MVSPLLSAVKAQHQHHAAAGHPYRSLSRRSPSPSTCAPGLAQRRRYRSDADGAAAGNARNRDGDSLPEPPRPISNRLSTEPILVVTALLSVFIVLGILYESLIHPLTIISTLPSRRASGAMLALMLFHIDLNVDLDHRHHSAHRHRQEERHHDDRFRAAGGAA